MGAAPAPAPAPSPCASSAVAENSFDVSLPAMKMMNQNHEEGEMKSKSTSPNWFPPGFRFHPTDEELVLYYLKRKIFRRRIKLPMIGDVDVYKWQPWELPDKSVVKSREKLWYFFSPRDRKYPNGSRSNRATKYGYWKATGKDRSINHNSRTVGNKKTLVYYQGRPPKGERTDWVMHEYTLDDRELVINCNNINDNNHHDIQDYYALYKLFRKSGPGPKNGEDYGAPFREEEWNDDDDADNSCFTDNNNDNNNKMQEQLLHSDSVPRALDCHTDTNSLPDNYHLEQLLLQMSSELDIIQPHSQCASYVPQTDVEEEVGSHLVGPSSFVDATCVELDNAWWEQGSGFQIAPSASAAGYVHSVDRPEVTALISCSEQDQLKTDEEFLEIKDFIDQDSLVWSMEDDSHNDRVPKIDELYDPYDYFDAHMYLAEAMGPLDGTPSNLYSEDFCEASHMTTELWTHDQEFNVSTVSQSDKAVRTSPAASGMVYASGSLSDIGDDQEQDSHAASPSQSWLSSALSAFLDSVPSSPAMASESPLINKALERVSSFRAGQIWGAAGPSSAATDNNNSVVGRKRGTRIVGFLATSFLVGFGAVLLTSGFNVKLIKGLWNKFLPS